MIDVMFSIITWDKNWCICHFIIYVIERTSHYDLITFISLGRRHSFTIEHDIIVRLSQSLCKLQLRVGRIRYIPKSSVSIEQWRSEVCCSELWSLHSVCSGTFVSRKILGYLITILLHYIMQLIMCSVILCS